MTGVTGTTQSVIQDFVFDEISEVEIVRILAKYPADQRAAGTLPLLHLVQQQMFRITGHSWVPQKAVEVVAKKLNIAPARVAEVVSFYSMFSDKPIGQYHLQVCTTTPCWLRGSDQIAAACRKVTGLNGYGTTTEDGLFTMTEVECLGACANAPILQINNDYYEDITGEKTEELLNMIKRGELLPKPGSVIGRFGSKAFDLDAKNSPAEGGE